MRLKMRKMLISVCYVIFVDWQVVSMYSSLVSLLSPVEDPHALHHSHLFPQTDSHLACVARCLSPLANMVVPPSRPSKLGMRLKTSSAQRADQLVYIYDFDYKPARCKRCRYLWSGELLRSKLFSAGSGCAYAVNVQVMGEVLVARDKLPFLCAFRAPGT